MSEDAFGRPGYGHKNVDSQAKSFEEDALRQIEAAAAENPDNEKDMTKRDVEADKAFEDPSVNPAVAPDDEDEDMDVNRATADDDGMRVFETAEESRADVEER